MIPDQGGGLGGKRETRTNREREEDGWEEERGGGKSRGREESDKLGT